METLKYFFTSLALLVSSFFQTTTVKDVHMAQPIVVAIQETSSTSKNINIRDSLVRQENTGLVYKNNRLGFSLIFPDSWTGYRYQEGTTTVSFGVKDQDLN